MGLDTTFPIMVHSIFPTWSISNRCKNEKELEEWLAKWKLNIVSATRCGDYLSITAASQEVTNIEKVL